MGFTVTELRERPHQEKHTSPRKSASGEFFANSNKTRQENHRQPSKTRQGNRPTPTKTASGVFYYGYRYYDPVTGRWPSRDPLEENFETWEFNMYAFVNNDALNYWDVLGHLRGRGGSIRNQGPAGNLQVAARNGRATRNFFNRLMGRSNRRARRTREIYVYVPYCIGQPRPHVIHAPNTRVRYVPVDCSKPMVVVSEVPRPNPNPRPYPYPIDGQTPDPQPSPSPSPGPMPAIPTCIFSSFSPFSGSLGNSGGCYCKYECSDGDWINIAEEREADCLYADPPIRVAKFLLEPLGF